MADKLFADQIRELEKGLKSSSNATDLMKRNFAELDKFARQLASSVDDLQDNFQDVVDISKQYFNPHNMFICKNKEILTKYYESVIPWLERCETHFGFNDLKGFGLKRIYGFLAERYLSYWFQKNTNFTTMPIYFKDISYLSL